MIPYKMRLVNPDFSFHGVTLVRIQELFVYIYSAVLCGSVDDIISCTAARSRRSGRPHRHPPSRGAPGVSKPFSDALFNRRKPLPVVSGDRVSGAFKRRIVGARTASTAAAAAAGTAAACGWRGRQYREHNTHASAILWSKPCVRQLWAPHALISWRCLWIFWSDFLSIFSPFLTLE